MSTRSEEASGSPTALQLAARSLSEVTLGPLPLPQGLAADLQAALQRPPVPAAAAVAAGSSPLPQAADSGAAQEAVPQAAPTAADCAGAAELGSREETLDCRICLQEVWLGRAADGHEGAGLHLGCDCGSAAGTVHLDCARRWFLQRHSIVCEVCGKEACGLPRELVQEVEQQRQQAEASINITLQLHNRVEALVQRRSWTELAQEQARLLAVYLLACLLPAVALGLLLGWFYYSVIGLAPLPTMILAVVLACAAMVSCVQDDNLPAHLLYTIGYAGCIVGSTYVLTLVIPGLLGAALAAVINMWGLFYLKRLSRPGR